MERVNNSDTSVDQEIKAKRDVELKEGLTVATGTDTPPEFSEPPQFDAARTRKLRHKLDWHLVPFLSLLYL
jgi:hypothetical protein